MSLEHAPGRQEAAIPGIGRGLREFNRFVDLREAGLFRSRMTLWRAVRANNFPAGRLLGNARIWTRAEILEALAKLPTSKDEEEAETE